MENNMEVPQRADESAFALAYIAKEKKNSNSKKYMHPNVCGIICSNHH